MQQQTEVNFHNVKSNIYTSLCFRHLAPSVVLSRFGIIKIHTMIGTNNDKGKYQTIVGNKEKMH